MKERIKEILLRSGAVAIGMSRAGYLPEEVMKIHEQWIADDNHAGMDYLQRHLLLKQTTDNVLSGAKTVISLAFSYVPPVWRNDSLPMIACYAYGRDYHDIIRHRLDPLIDELRKIYGGEWRVCIDSAPVAERYWALKSGVGISGKNGCVIVKGAGSLCFLTEILTTLELEPDEPSTGDCGNCGRCRTACPTGALRYDGTIDARLCLSYLTIEKKDDFSQKDLQVLKNPGDNLSVLFGCDRCVRTCPHNDKGSHTKIEEFYPSDNILNFTSKEIEALDDSNFNTLFKNSPLKRASIKGIKRNANAIFFSKNLNFKI